MKYFKTLAGAWAASAAGLYALFTTHAAIPAGQEKAFAVGCVVAGWLPGHLVAKIATEPPPKK